MSTESVSSGPAAIRTRQSSYHPLSPLTALEITTCAELIRGLYPANTTLQFKAITLEEPEKHQLLPLLTAEHHGLNTPPIERKAFACYYIKNTVRLCLDLDDGHELTIRSRTNSTKQL